MKTKLQQKRKRVMSFKNCGVCGKTTNTPDWAKFIRLGVDSKYILVQSYHSKCIVKYVI